MRPVKRALKMLENPEENTSEKDQVTQTKQVKKIPILSILPELSISAVLSRPGTGPSPEQWLELNEAQPEISCPPPPHPPPRENKKPCYNIKAF